MDSVLKSLLGHGGSRKLLWIPATLFAAIILLQYVVLPNGDYFYSIFSFWKIIPQQQESTNFRPQNSNTANHLVDNLAMAPGPDGNTGPAHASPPVKSMSMQNVSAPKFIIPPPTPPPPKMALTTSQGKVYTIREMDQFLAEGGRTHLMNPLWSSKADIELVNVKLEMEKAQPPLKDDGLHGVLYRNVTMFQRSYNLMEKTLKVYVYKEGNKPVFHQPTLRGVYSSEGWFMKLIESSKQFITENPEEAHLFYIPFSSKMLLRVLSKAESEQRIEYLVEYMKNYLDTIVSKYPFWNRTGGADHFIVACHDWAPSVTRDIMSRCIRALCNADAHEGFVFGKDVSLPETKVLKAVNPLMYLGGKPPSERKTLAFFAGKMHGYLRPIILHHWKNVAPDIKVFEKLSGAKGLKMYISYMQGSKYCICPKGYEVNSPRVVESIFYECVPVIISDNFVPPFFETLNWESFTIFVLEKDVPNLKKILVSIPEEKYMQMYARVKEVQNHFLWHHQPVRHDLFHMILHSVWYNRVFESNV